MAQNSSLEGMARVLAKHTSSEEKKAVEDILHILTFYWDHPIKGHPFVNIFPIFKFPSLVQALLDAFVTHMRSLPCFSTVTALLVLEARGFVFGPLLAASLKLPWVPVRKRGKLPGATVAVQYAKVYEEDTWEIKTDAFDGIPDGDVILLDDLVAMGGSAKAAKDCVEKLTNGARKVVEACFIFGIPEVEYLVKEKMEATGIWSWIQLHQDILGLLPKGT